MITPSGTQYMRIYNFGLMVAKKMPTMLPELSEDVIAYYEQNHDKIKEAVIRGFTIPQKETVPAPPEVVTVTNLDWWIDKTQKFTKEYLGVDIDLRERFDIPAELRWDSVIPIFDPGNLNNKDAVHNALRSQKLVVFEESEVSLYSGSEPSGTPTLHFIEKSVRPNRESMNLSPDTLRTTGENYLDMRGYVLAMAVYHFATGKYLDTETFTWFPESRMPGENVGCGFWFPGDSSNCLVGLYLSYPSNRNDHGGARVAIAVPLKP